MDFEAGLRLLRLLGTREASALSVREIRDKWPIQEGGVVSFRTIQRYIAELSAIENGNLLREVQNSPGSRYYLATSQVASWFLSEEAALNLQLTKQTTAQSFLAGSKNSAEKLSDMAEHLINRTPQSRRLRDRLRVVADGIGRLPAAIDPEVLSAIIAAISENQKVRIQYLSSKGNASELTLNPLGLVAKDGSIYLVAVTGLDEAPRPYPLHRASAAAQLAEVSQADSNFDLDAYISATHNFSHALDSQAVPVTLELSVAPEAMYHFRERKLTAEQQILEPSTPGGWYKVIAEVPETIQLVPFLLSMGPWIEVLGPATVREEVAERAQKMHALYNDLEEFPK
ncbi:hypothetical protein AEM42_03815 [Betaproteobacteria bacterium UKL13-2]|nr:hypothetical protein AEM42_03815 [Betaproteobacteria bacterium UKL13-2]HCG52408.1 hypothetical protein [Betaproteobacteria bacterium]